MACCATFWYPGKHYLLDHDTCEFIIGNGGLGKCWQYSFAAPGVTPVTQDDFVYTGGTIPAVPVQVFP